jgi:hypothetical protein
VCFCFSPSSATLGLAVRFELSARYPFHQISAIYSKYNDVASHIRMRMDRRGVEIILRKEQQPSAADRLIDSQQYVLPRWSASQLAPEEPIAAVQNVHIHACAD